MEQKTIRDSKVPMSVVPFALVMVAATGNRQDCLGGQQEDAPRGESHYLVCLHFDPLCVLKARLS